jgi:hypothetical protein
VAACCASLFGLLAAAIPVKAGSLSGLKLTAPQDNTKARRFGRRSFTFLDTSSKYLVLAGVSARVVASGFYIVHREHRLRVRNRAALDVEMEALAKKL